MTPPTKIYLQTGDIPEDVEWSELVGVTWHSKRVHKTDIEYIHIDRVKELLKQQRVICAEYARTCDVPHREGGMLMDIITVVNTESIKGAPEPNMEE